MAFLLLLAGGGKPPKVGYELPGGRLAVSEGGRLRPATPAEGRLILGEPVPPPHPSGRYRTVRARLKGDEWNGGLTGWKLLDRGGHGVADPRWLFGREAFAANNALDIVGWGPGPDDVVVRASGGSPSLGETAVYRSLNVRTRRVNDRVVLAGGKGGLGLVIGNGPAAEEDGYKGAGRFPRLYRLVAGHPVPLKIDIDPLEAGSPSVSPDGGWVLASGPGNCKSLIDLRTGHVTQKSAWKARFVR